MSSVHDADYSSPMPYMWADTLEAAERAHLLRLLVWGGVSVLTCTALLAWLRRGARQSPLLKHFAIQFLCEIDFPLDAISETHSDGVSASMFKAHNFWNHGCQGRKASHRIKKCKTTRCPHSINGGLQTPTCSRMFEFHAAHHGRAGAGRGRKPCIVKHEPCSVEQIKFCRLSQTGRRIVIRKREFAAEKLVDVL